MTERNIRVRISAQYDGYKRAMADMRAETEKTSAAFDRHGNKIETVSGRIVRSVQVNRQAWDTASRSMTVAGVAMAAAIGYVAKQAINWETAFTGVLKTVTGTHDELVQLEKDLRAIALVKPASQGEIAAVAEAAGQLGIATKDVAAFTAIMIDLGETTNLTSDEAATAIAQLMNVMQTAPDKVSNLGSALVALGNNGASTERDILMMAQRIAGAAKIIGLTEGEVLGLSNALASVGIEAEAGGSAVSNILIDISRAVATGSDDLTKWAQVAGMSAADFAAAWKNDPAEALTTLIEGLGDLNATGGDVFTTLAELGQADVRVTRALLTMATSGDLLRESLAQGADAWRDNNALAQEAAKRYDTTAAKAEIARNAINDAAIEVGDNLLPALAGAANAVASMSKGFADLPTSVQQTTIGLGAVLAVTLLTAGAFTRLVPALIETKAAMVSIAGLSPRTAAGISKIATAAFTAVTALTALDFIRQQGINSAKAEEVSYERATEAMLGVADGAKTIDESLSELGAFEVDTNWFETWSGGEKTVNSLGEAFDALAFKQKSLKSQMGEIYSNGDFYGTNDVKQAENAVKTLDSALTALVSSGAPEKAQKIVDALPVGAKEALKYLPNYTDALAAMANEQKLAADPAKQLAEAQEESQEAFEKWRAVIATADSSFVVLQDAYASVIDKNIEFAQSTADATESADDSWQTYYDGVSVSADDYIAQLQAQVDAQNNWETNILAISARVRDGLSSDMQSAGEAMLDELLALGPEGAAQVDLLAQMTDEQFTQVVTLWSQKGTDAVAAFTAQVEAYRPPEIAPEVNLTPANATIDEWLRQDRAFALALKIAPESLKGGIQSMQMQSAARRAMGGPISGRGTWTSDSIPIWASNNEYMQPARAHAYFGTPFMEAVRRVDPGAAMAELSARGYRDGGAIAPAMGASHYYQAPNVVTVPVESRHTTEAPVNFSGNIYATDMADIERQARAARRRAHSTGGRS